MSTPRKLPAPKGKLSLGRMLEVHKALWLPFALGCIAVTGNGSMRAWLMAGLFGAYGLLWLLKSFTFFDKVFYNDPAYHYGWLATLGNFLAISVYFLYPVVAVLNPAPLHPALAAVGVMLFVVGGFLHYAADAQKFYSLAYRPGVLITEGLFSRLRHPSYLGELLMWLGLTAIAGPTKLLAWAPVAFLLVATVVMGIPRKERSLARYEAYEAWRKRSWALLPKPGRPDRGR